MRARRTLPLFAIVPLLLVAASCGDDGGGGDDGGSGGGSGDQAAFCESLQQADEEGALEDDDVEGAIAAFDELTQDAPEEIQPSLDELRGAFERLADLDEEDPDDISAAFDILFDEDVIQAGQRLGEYASEECGIEGLSGFEDLSGDLSDLSGDVSEDFTDDFSDGGPSVSDRLRTFLDEQYPDFSDQVEGIGSVDLSADEAQVTLTIGDDPADVETGVAICEAVVEFADQDGLSSIDVEVENDENGDDELLATGDLDDGCEAA